jgi:hypothetical protein
LTNSPYSITGAWANTDYGHLDDIPGPIWDDVCGHKAEEYIGSFQVPEILSKNKNQWSAGQKCDVYVYKDATGIRSQCVCIRHSNEPGDYFSCGTVADLIATAARFDDDVIYQMAVSLICRKMICHWSRRD